MRRLRPRPLVMIVEDDPDVLLMLRVNLESGGFATVLAADGETALRRVDIDRPDAVLLDLMLPVMDGWEVLAALRSKPGAPPIVVCSARHGKADLEQAERLGVADYITKPFAMERVISALRRAVSGELEESDASATRPKTSSDPLRIL